MAAEAILDGLAAGNLPGLRHLPLLLLAAHPDDEVLGVGSRLPWLRGLQIVFVTDGAPRDMADARRLGFASREDYGRARACEAEAALASLEVERGRIRRLGLVDQEASLHLDDLAGGYHALLDEFKPAAVLTHAYEGGHPDHDAVALAAHLACGRRVPIIEFGGYHDPDGSGRVATDMFLPARVATVSLPLGRSEQARKREALACYATQAPVLAMFPHDRERLRVAPRYDFTGPAHPWPPYYERFVRGLDGRRWLELARDAVRRAGAAGAAR